MGWLWSRNKTEPEGSAYQTARRRNQAAGTGSRGNRNRNRKQQAGQGGDEMLDGMRSPHEFENRRRNRRSTMVWQTFRANVKQGKHAKLFHAVVDVVEHDKRRCTSAAACCACYMCMGPRQRRAIERIHKSKWYSMLHVFLSIYILFAADIVLAFFPKSLDNVFAAISVFSFCIFSLDMVFMSSLDRKHVYNFFWWMDLFATISILLDTPWAVQLLLSLAGGGATVVEATSAARAGSRVGRILRILRAVRLLRLIRLLKMSQIGVVRAKARKEEAKAADERLVSLMQSASALPLATLSEHSIDAKKEQGGEAPAMALHPARKFSSALLSPIQAGQPAAALPSALSLSQSRSHLMARSMSRGMSKSMARSMSRSMSLLQPKPKKRANSFLGRGINTMKNWAPTAWLKHASAPPNRKTLAATVISTKLEVKVIASVILVMLVMPLLDVDVDNFAQQSALNTLTKQLDLLPPALSANATDILVTPYIEMHQDLLYLQVGGTVYIHNKEGIDSKRTVEVAYVSGDAGSVAMFDEADQRSSESLWGFIRTNVIILLLAAQAFLLSRDIARILIDPLNRLTSKLSSVVPRALRMLPKSEARKLGARDNQPPGGFANQLYMIALEYLFWCMSGNERSEMVKQSARRKVLKQLRTRPSRLRHEFMAMQDVRSQSAGSLMAQLDQELLASASNVPRDVSGKDMVTVPSFAQRAQAIALAQAQAPAPSQRRVMLPKITSPSKPRHSASSPAHVVHDEHDPALGLYEEAAQHIAIHDHDQDPDPDPDPDSHDHVVHAHHGNGDVAVLNVSHTSMTAGKGAGTAAAATGDDAV